MKKIVLILVMLVSYACSFDRISLEYGYKDSIDVYGLSLFKDFDYKLFDIADLSLEVTTEYVDGKNDSMAIISTQPLATIDITENLYFEAGLGVAYFSKEHLDHKQFGMNFQFKESIGFGYRFNDDFDATLKYNHYSNANLDDDNSGLDFVGLKVAYRF